LGNPLLGRADESLWAYYRSQDTPALEAGLM